jgi:chromosome segregation ATPase
MKHIKLFEDFINEAISVDAAYVHQITRCGQDAAQNFIDDNKIDGKKLADYVKQHRDSKEKYDVRDIIAGTGVGANKSFVKRFIKELK